MVDAWCWPYVISALGSSWNSVGTCPRWCGGVPWRHLLFRNEYWYFPKFLAFPFGQLVRQQNPLVIFEFSLLNFLFSFIFNTHFPLKYVSLIIKSINLLSSFWATNTSNLILAHLPCRKICISFHPKHEEATSVFKIGFDPGLRLGLVWENPDILLDDGPLSKMASVGVVGTSFDSLYIPEISKFHACHINILDQPVTI